MSLARRVAAQWYRPRLTPLTALLTPLAALFGALAALRRALYRWGWLRSTRLPVPVVVIGNVTVGGTGKTPLVRGLADALRARGWHPGIVSRGYGGRVRRARIVRPDDAAAEVGDEPLLLAADAAPVAIGRDRAEAAAHLLVQHPEVDVILADDGLQHYALARDVEIVVIDALRGFGNGRLLPAGPLREPADRATAAHARVLAGPDAAPPVTASARTFRTLLAPLAWRTLRGGASVPDFEALPAGTVHAVAGIAHPERFFATLARMGIVAVEHPFDDHHAYAAHELRYPGARAILMTEKDAVKCAAIADERMFWLPVRATVDPALVTLIEDTIHGSQAARAPGLPRHQGTAHL